MNDKAIVSRIWPCFKDDEVKPGMISLSILYVVGNG